MTRVPGELTIVRMHKIIRTNSVASKISIDPAVLTILQQLGVEHPKASDDELGMLLVRELIIRIQRPKV